MKKYLLLHTLFCLAIVGRAEGEIQISADNAQAAYMGSYTQDDYGVWQLVLASGTQVVASFEIDAASTKRIARPILSGLLT